MNQYDRGDGVVLNSFDSTIPGSTIDPFTGQAFGSGESGYTPSRDGASLDELYKLAQSNPAYWEAYFQLLAERENTTSAQAWYEKMSGSQYQRAVKDLQAAGLNPYLALTALSGAGSGSVTPAGTWSSSPYSNKTQREALKANKESADASMIKALAGVATSVIALVALLA